MAPNTTSNKTVSFLGLDNIHLSTAIKKYDYYFRKVIGKVQNGTQVFWILGNTPDKQFEEVFPILK